MPADGVAGPPFAYCFGIATVTARPTATRPWLAGVLPAVAAASFGIRNQAEFEIVVHRSRRLRERLARERDRLVRLARERDRLVRLDGTTLTSTVLHREIARCAALMAADTAEWAAIFEVKESEVV